MRIEPFELLGEFWLPESPTVKVHGYVRVGNGGRVTLDLFGLLIPSQGQNAFQRRYERVVGNVMGHECVTLEKCVFESGQRDWFGTLAKLSGVTSKPATAGQGPNSKPASATGTLGVIEG